MKKILVSSLILLSSVSAVLTSCSQKSGKVDLGELKTFNDSVACAIGTLQGRQMAEFFKSQNLNLNNEIISRAFYQSIMGDTTGAFSTKDAHAVWEKFQLSVQQQQQKEISKAAIPNRKKAEVFLEQNKTQTGVKTTESGLQYKIVKAGKNQKHPAKGERVRIKYRLKNLDGKVIESSFESNEPVAPMGVSNFIPGFSEGLTLMTEGATYMFWIHPDLAYGDNDSPEIPAGSLLWFEVELLEVIK